MQHPLGDHVCDSWAPAGASAPWEGTPLILGLPPSREKCSTCSLPQGPTPSLQEKVGTFPGTSTHFWSGPGRSTQRVPTAQRRLGSSCPFPRGPSGSPHPSLSSLLPSPRHTGALGGARPGTRPRSRVTEQGALRGIRGSVRRSGREPATPALPVGVPSGHCGGLTAPASPRPRRARLRPAPRSSAAPRTREPVTRCPPRT